MYTSAHIVTVVLSDPPMDEDHRITPILKLIDFGYSSYVNTGRDIVENIFEIGTVCMFHRFKY